MAGDVTSPLIVDAIQAEIGGKHAFFFSVKLNLHVVLDLPMPHTVNSGPD